VSRLSRLTWPRARRDEAVAAAAGGGLARPGPADVREIESEVGDLDAMLRSAPPALLRLEEDGEERFLALARRRGRRLCVVAPDGAEHRVPCREVADLVRGSALASAPRREGLRALLSTIAGNEGPRANRRRQRALDELVGPARVRGCWLIRPRDGTRGEAREAGAWDWIAPFVAAHALQLGLWIAAWAVLAATAARADFGAPPLAMLALVLGTMVLGRAIEAHAARMIALGAGTVIKRRLLDGSLRLGPDEVRGEGVGAYLARVLDTEAIETAGLTGAFLAINAAGSAVVTAFILYYGAGGGSHAVLFLAWAAGLGALGLLAYGRRQRWTAARLALTAYGVEQMVGHATRLAQLSPDRRHDREDALLSAYVAGRRSVDGATVAVELGRRGWMYAGLLALAGPFIGGAASGTAFVVSVGGVLLGYQALSNATQSLARLSAAVIALRNLRPFWNARQDPASAPREGAAPARRCDAAGGEAGPLIEARDLAFRHVGRRDPVIRQAGLTVGGNDHVLLVGPSGSGKSTLAALLAGLRRPDSGLLFFRGLDRDTLGSDAWRRGIVLAPQFQDNHLLVGPLAYNLLLGRRWPPTPADLEEASALCEDLGLGPLLARMPLGLYQPVGESGWQLSHGERSRVFAGRAILQKPDLLILDESFAALDPETFAQTLQLVVARSSAVMMIAHP
jgi:ATP-binding cassette, subfamily B, bacterial